MSKKYHASTVLSNHPADSCTIITNDLFLAAFLVSAGCELDRIEKNDRRRVSFVFVGSRVRGLREAYRTGPVHIDMRNFRENLNRLRDRLGEAIGGQHPEERSAAHEHAATKLSRLPSYAHA
jgi:hypothetical protein